MELPDKRDKFPHQLSGGEQQRIVLARALLNAPPIILADEPTGNIDPETSYRLVELLKDISDSGKTVVIATHQYDLIAHFPGRVFCCENGMLQEDCAFTEKLALRNKVISNEIVTTDSSITVETINTSNEKRETTSLDENLELSVPVESELQKVQETITITKESEYTETTVITKDEITITEENTETNSSSANEENKKKDDDGPDIVGFELI